MQRPAVLRGRNLSVRLSFHLCTLRQYRRLQASFTHARRPPKWVLYLAAWLHDGRPSSSALEIHDFVKTFARLTRTRAKVRIEIYSLKTEACGFVVQSCSRVGLYSTRAANLRANAFFTSTRSRARQPTVEQVVSFLSQLIWLLLVVAMLSSFVLVIHAVFAVSSKRTWARERLCRLMSPQSCSVNTEIGVGQHWA